MNNTLLLITFCFGIALALFAGLAILLYYRPGLAQPFVRLLRRWKWAGRKIDSHAVRAAAADPETVAASLPEKQAEVFRRSMEGRSEAERAAVIERAQELVEKGQTQRAAEIIAARPKSASDRQAAAKKKRKARQKRKQARQQKRK